MRALVTGATGVVGPAVVRALTADGIDVSIFARTAPSSELMPRNVKVVIGDVGDPSALARAVSGMDVIHHLAGVAHKHDLAGSDVGLFETVNVTGTRNVARAARFAGTEHLVIYGSIAVYGPNRSPQTIDESWPLRPVGVYAESKARAEEVARTEFGTSATTLRLATVIGPHMKGNYRTLARAIERGRFVSIGALTNRRTLVSAEDVGVAAVLVTKAEAARGRVFNVTDGDVHTLREIAEAIAFAAHRRLPRWRLPLAPVVALAQVGEMARRVGLPLPPMRLLLAKYLEDVAVSGDRLQRELGFQPSGDLRSYFSSALAYLS